MSVQLYKWQITIYENRNEGKERIKGEKILEQR